MLHECAEVYANATPPNQVFLLFVAFTAMRRGSVDARWRSRGGARYPEMIGSTRWGQPLVTAVGWRPPARWIAR